MHFLGKNPILSSVVALVVVFVIVLVVLMLTKPKFVCKDDTAKKQVAWDKLIAYSALIGVVVAILVLLIGEVMPSQKRTGSMYGRRSRFRYCGADM